LSFGSNCDVAQICLHLPLRLFHYPLVLTGGAILATIPTRACGHTLPRDPFVVGGRVGWAVVTALDCVCDGVRDHAVVSWMCMWEFILYTTAIHCAYLCPERAWTSISFHISCQPVIWRVGVRGPLRGGVCIRNPEYGGVAALPVTLSQCYRPRDWYIEGQVSWHFGSLPAESGGRWPLCVTRFFCDGP